MPHFRRHDDMKTWFNGIVAPRNIFAIEFDAYYVCALIGLAKGEWKALETTEARDMTPAWPKPYLESRHLLMGLLLLAELHRFGNKDLDKRKTVNREITRLFDPDDSTKLTNEGMNHLNQYAHAGFHCLQREYGKHKPRDVNDFLVRYHEQLQEAINKSSVYSSFLSLKT